MLIKFDARNEAVLTQAHPAGLFASGLASARQIIAGGWAAVLEGVAIGLESLQGQAALFAAHVRTQTEVRTWDMNAEALLVSVEDNEQQLDRTLATFAPPRDCREFATKKARPF